jgi:hypothetical protein
MGRLTTQGPVADPLLTRAQVVSHVGLSPGIVEEGHLGDWTSMNTS